ncbi:hypothetical protein HYH02_010686 [Chlamydomonas schloesseri]|uniref:Uncharacterized protein n=1 Tax=Chlamydomonas schloesseri TaxID=2026947 RepID=A0A835TJI8_9CHLO|nr:hypothetical protein HYH02_010686 [Chlamydomonas schloesseri]|eukprot:KAG2438890.1 hypothetical protein HYH02_010686 [Chlamydomonas schloesseri]
MQTLKILQRSGPWRHGQRCNALQSGVQVPFHVAVARNAIRGCKQRTARWRTSQAKAGAAPASLAPVSDVFVLDFDGVVVDSEPEITASAFEAAAIRWPGLFGPGALSDERRAALREAMRTVRPVLVKGYESMVMLRLLLRDPNCVVTLRAILGRWGEELPRALAEWGESEAELSKLFESVRNEWMTGRTESWMALQVPYEGVTEALRGCPFPTYIASSKAAHRVAALSRAVLGLDLPADSPRLFASLLPPEEKKAEALSTIGSRPLCAAASTRLHFVDDRLDTLRAVAAVPELAARWKLYLADWGYNTAEEREAAAREPGVRVLSLPEFNELLRFGLVMGVDDGCEPTQEEVEAGV